MPATVGSILDQWNALTGNATFMIGFSAFAAAALVFGLLQLIRDLRRHDQQRVDDRLMGKRSDKKGAQADKMAPAFIKKADMAAAGKGIWGAIGRLSPIAWLQQACLQADLDWNAARLMARTIFLGAVLTTLFAYIGLDLVRALALGACVPAFPIVYVIMRRKRRLDALVEQLPDAFDMIAQALRAGQSLPSAVGLISEQLPDPIRTEFALVYQEQKLGMPFEEALGQFAARVKQMDATFFVTAVQIQRQSGGDLAEVLDNIGEIIRDRIKLYGHVRALSAEGRLSGWILLALPPVMLLVELFLNPSYAGRLLNTDFGHMLLWGAAISQFLGLLMIRKIVNIKV
ncbi:MAG TPA: type II secretion system F family protein [Phycisphaerae bacterium]|nr:type II secretion system F family protein [Phycisphaerae bacterium]